MSVSTLLLSMGIHSSKKFNEEEGQQEVRKNNTFLRSSRPERRPEEAEPSDESFTQGKDRLALSIHPCGECVRSTQRAVDRLGEGASWPHVDAKAKKRARQQIYPNVEKKKEDKLIGVV